MNVTRNPLRTTAALAVLLLILTACGEGSGPGRSDARSGALIVAVRGLPAGLEAGVEVSGPHGYRMRVPRPTALQGLAPGSYDVVAAGISTSSAAWVGRPEYQRLIVESGKTLHASVNYEAQAGPPLDTPGSPEPQEPTPDGPKYFVDCQAGNDDAPGTSADSAWRTLQRASRADLLPGDSLLLKRGCSWDGALRVPWSGTAEHPIMVGAYGTGDLPRIHGVAGTLVHILGSYVVVDSLHAEVDTFALPTDPRCDDQPYGWHVGFSLGARTVHSTIRNSRANGGTAGISIEPGASLHRIVGNSIYDNVVMSVNTPGGGEDSGAWGVLVNGDDNEIAYNRFSNNTAWCSYDFGIDGAAIEVFTGKRNNIHHNVSVSDTTFAELGGWGADKAEDTTFSYNLMYSEEPGAHFLIVVGSLHSAGPTPRTRVYNNTVHLTSAENTQGVVCYAGCTPDLLSMHNNILWVNWRSFYTDGPLTESHNLYWRSDGRPLADYQGSAIRSASSISADPRFTSVEDADYRLRADSPAIDAGLEIGPELRDLAGNVVPRGAGRDMGAFEY